MNTSNIDIVLITLNFLHRKFQNGSQFSTLINLLKLTDRESSASINDKIMYQNNISEKIYSHQYSAEIIDHARDDIGINLVNIEEEVNITCINCINLTDYMYVNVLG